LVPATGAGFSLATGGACLPLRASSKSLTTSSLASPLKRKMNPLPSWVGFHSIFLESPRGRSRTTLWWGPQY
jgi:hypothetical protein